MTDAAFQEYRRRNANEVKITPVTLADHEDNVSEMQLALNAAAEVFQWIAQGEMDDRLLRAVARMAGHATECMAGRTADEATHYALALRIYFEKKEDAA